MANQYLNYITDTYNNNRKVSNYVLIGAFALLVLWLIWRRVFARTPEQGIGSYNDPKDGINNGGFGLKDPFGKGGKINISYFSGMTDLYAFLNEDGKIDATDAAHEIAYAMQRNQADWSTNGCENSLTDLCNQLDNLMQQPDDFIKATNKEYKRIYGKYINDDLPSFYNVFSCKCDKNDAYKAKLSKLV